VALAVDILGILAGWEYMALELGIRVFKQTEAGKALTDWWRRGWGRNINRRSCHNTCGSECQNG
jgi:hypothetical protein